MKRFPFRFPKAIVLFSATVVLFSSCDDIEEALSESTIYDLDEAGELEAIRDQIIEKAGDVEVYELNFTSSDELRTHLNQAELITEKSEELLDRTTYYLDGSFETRSNDIDNEFFIKNFREETPKKVSELDFDLITKNVNAAKALVPKEYVDPAIYSYSIQMEDGKRSDKLVLNYLMEGESDHMEGRNIVTNYYEFKFETDENGAIVVDE